MDQRLLFPATERNRGPIGDLLKQLSWSSDQARTFLQQQLGATSRQQLSDEQLLEFNMLLEEQTLKVS